MWDLIVTAGAATVLAGLTVLCALIFRTPSRRPPLRARRDGEPLGQRIEDARREWDGQKARGAARWN